MPTVTSANKDEFDRQEMAKRNPPMESTAQAPKGVDMNKWMSMHNKNEDRNMHSENAVRATALVGHIPHHEETLGILQRHLSSNEGINDKDYKRRGEIMKEHMPKIMEMHKNYNKK